MISQSPLQVSKRQDKLSELFNRANYVSNHEAQVRRPLSQFKRPNEDSSAINRQSLLTPQSNARDSGFNFIQPKDRVSVQRMKMKKQISEYGTHNIRPNPPASTIISKNKGYLKMNDDDHQTQSLVSIASQRVSLETSMMKQLRRQDKLQTSFKHHPYYGSFNGQEDMNHRSKRNDESTEQKQIPLTDHRTNTKTAQEQRVHTDGDANESKAHRSVRQPQPTSARPPCMILQGISQVTIPLDPSRYSTAKNGIIRNYAANTHQGLVRNYNEDRVSIIVNVNQGQRQNWPNCSYFAVYDGHGGSQCSDYLRDNLHLYVIKDENFPRNPKLAIQNGFEQAEINFTQMCLSGLTNGVERSGSCAVSVMIVGDQCYVANVGDSRAIMSSDGGKRVQALTRDHKPMDDGERIRIMAAGGRIYQSQIQNPNRRSQPTLGPHRVFPGRLSVTRSFGDIEAKLEQLGGMKGVVIAQPEVFQFKIQDNHDFILLASDGVFDKVSNEEIVQAVWETQAQIKQKTKVHEFGASAVENVMKFTLFRKTLDNITVVLVGFPNFKRHLNLGKSIQPQPPIVMQKQYQSYQPNEVKRVSYELQREQKSAYDHRTNYAIQA